MQRAERYFFWSGFLLALALAAPVLAEEKEPTAERIEFFEKKIRPVLVDKCYTCHSHEAKKVKGEYYLDSRDALRKGGESGVAVVPGDVSKSPLIKMIRREDEDAAMPPKEKDALTPEQVKDFEEWVKQGVPDPRKEAGKSASGQRSANAADASDSRDHWAFKKPVEPAVPPVRDAEWVQSPIDAFVLARLESKGMMPAPQADRRTLIRRAYFSLTGLPPTPAEVSAFEADASPDAFAKVVDHLLASPRYGERWGRYWLDVARYADTKGYVFEEERKYPYAYTYRDYVVRAFNEDLPYDQFLIQQIAADKLDLGEDKLPLAAMGFLTVGRRFLNNQQDVIDDRIDVVTRGTMALTVQCARCHDHKYDPIPTADYYSLYGVFSSSVEPATYPSIGKSDQNAASLAFEQELKTREAAVEAFLAGKADELFKRLRSAKSVADCMLAGQFEGTQRQSEFGASALEVNRRLAKKWGEFLAASKTGHDPIFAPWQAYAALSKDDFAARSAETTSKLFATVDPTRPINAIVAAAFRDKPPASLREAADVYGGLIAAHDAEAAFPEPDKEGLRMVLHGLFSPLNDVKNNRGLFLRRDEQTALRELRKKVDQLRANDPGAPPAAMVMNDGPAPADVRVFKRGNAGMPGDVAPRQFLECVSTGKRKPFTDGSGRLELARAIASPENPLTARVMVNRVWLNQFGAALVRTPSDFGVRSDAPVYPEVLDWLALRFIEKGWSVKQLQRTIMLSSTWQQASDNPNPDYAVADPENTLLWKQNRRRMDFEAMRDTLIAVADQLDETIGGRAVDITDPANNRRTIYGFIDRQNLPGMFRTFDFASPDQHSPGRFFTTVPQQALFMLNSPLLERTSREVASREDLESAPSDAARIDQLYRTLYGRGPSAEETSDGMAFVNAENAQPVVGVSPWRYGYGRYEAAHDRVVDFTPFKHFAEGKWQVAPAEVAASAKLKWTLLFSAGGHPGADASASSIRRWIAREDGTLTIAGILAHKPESGDGVLARIVSSRVGQLASWTIHRSEAATNLSGISVQKGEIVDFVVECRSNENSDSYEWSPTLRLAGPRGAVAGGEGVLESDAQRDFSGTTPSEMSAWEKYAQVLLLSNEFSFVD